MFNFGSLISWNIINWVEVWKKFNTTRNHGLIGKLDKKLVILIFGQFDHLVRLEKLIWTCPTWLVVFFTDHKMVFLIGQIKQNKVSS
jgi:hypothetical protein